MAYRVFVIITLSLIFGSCLNDSGTESQKSNKVIYDNAFIGEWTSVEKVIPYRSKLIINKDSSFSYKFGACLSEGFSNGSWTINGSSIFLNSVEPDSCYYLMDFGINCELISDSINNYEIKTTLSGCMPKNQTQFVSFNHESFMILNDTLIYTSNKDTICPEMNDKFYRTKKNTTANSKYK